VAQLSTLGIIAMSQSVRHYLDIYKQRQQMAASGVAKASVEARAFIDLLVTRLSELEPSLSCELSKTRDSDGSAWFVFVVEGRELARYRIPKEFDI